MLVQIVDQAGSAKVISGGKNFGCAILDGSKTGKVGFMFGEGRGQGVGALLATASSVDASVCRTNVAVCATRDCRLCAGGAIRKDRQAQGSH